MSQVQVKQVSTPTGRKIESHQFSRTPGIGQTVQHCMTTKQIIQQFGEKSLPHVPNLSQLIAMLPTESRFNDMDKLRNAVTQWEAAAARMGE